jgi:hypothetical protein
MHPIARRLLTPQPTLRAFGNAPAGQVLQRQPAAHS